MSKITLILSAMMFALMARAEIKLVPIDYTEAGTQLQGFLAYDDAVTTPRPGVLVFPEWWGLTDYPQMRAKMLAELGYVAFAADMYGKGVTTDDPKKAGSLAGPFLQDRAKMRSRAMAALDTLKQQKQVDGSKLAAIGYCFGGTCALELARGGADVVSIISFHGNLSAPNPANEQIKPKILICTGAEDPMVPMDQVMAFQKEMKAVNANAQINIYPFAVHAFTNPKSDEHHIPGIAYNKQADERSWNALKMFFAETLGGNK